MAQDGRGDRVEHGAEVTQRTIEASGVQRLPAIGTDPSQVRRFSGSDCNMGAQPMKPIGQQLSDPPEAQHQTLHPQERPVQMLHSDLEGRLRRGRRVGNGQLFPLEVVHQRQPAVLSLYLLGGTNLPCQQQLAGTETAEQRTGGQILRLTV